MQSVFAVDLFLQKGVEPHSEQTSVLRSPGLCALIEHTQVADLYTKRLFKFSISKAFKADQSSSDEK